MGRTGKVRKTKKMRKTRRKKKMERISMKIITIEKRCPKFLRILLTVGFKSEEILRQQFNRLAVF